MKRNIVIAAFLAAASWHVSASAEVLAAFSNDKPPAPFASHGQSPNAEVTLDTAAPAGAKGSIKIAFPGGPVPEVLLFDAKLSGVDDCVLWYETAVKCEGITNKAYLEMWVTFPDGNSYFSRGLDQLVTGTRDWQRCRIPFILKKGESPTSVAMGVHFEGTGVVWLSDACLTKETNQWFNRPGSRGALLGIVGGTLGGLVGIWGSLVGYLAPRGKGRRFVLVSGIGFLAAGVVSLLLGVFCFFQGYPWDVYYGLLLLGGIDVLVLGPMLPARMRLYKQVEAQRLQAQDLAANL